MDIKARIEDTKKGFESSFASGDYYNRQTQDPVHLEKILQFVEIREGMTILDLGTGSGYLSFPIARNHPGCEVIGLDIVRDALEANQIRAEAEEICNLSFVNYDGIDFPFAPGTFDLIVTRYALHHFPDIGHSIGEISRVLKAGGMLFISDPCPNECDTDRFVDAYMRLKKDGHNKLYTEDEWTAICSSHGLHIVKSFESTLRFPRKKDPGAGYEEVLRRHDRSVIESYDLVETDTELYITERVNNILFVKAEMDLVRTTDFEMVKAKYMDVTENSPEIRQYARWVYGRHPTDDSLRAYIDNGEMYVLRAEDEVVGMVAVVMHQGQDYADVSWAEDLADDEVATLHLLTVCPDHRGRALGLTILEKAAELARRNGKKALRLDTLESNFPARHMYDKAGFSYRGKKYAYAENTGWMDFFFYEKKLD